MPTRMWKKKGRVYVAKWISGAGDRATPQGPSEWLGTGHGQRGPPGVDLQEGISVANEWPLCGNSDRTAE